jgi:hypothetical protein
VGPGGTARGIVLEEFGALFTLEGSVDGEMILRVPRPPRAPRVMIDGEDVRVVPAPDPDPEHEELHKSWEEFEKEAEAKSLEMYAGLKVELTDALIDYGATLGELGNDKWVAIAAFLDSRDFMGGGDSGKRLVLKARIRDLRQYAAGNLSRDAAVSKVVVEER